MNILKFINLNFSKNYKLLNVNRYLSSKTDFNLLKFNFEVNKFNDVHIKSNNVKKFTQETNSSLDLFESTLKNSLEEWKTEKRSAVWYYLPIDLSHLAVILSKYGFKYHHAENDEAVLAKWLSETRESKIPLFATHQMGVAGLVYRQDKNQILCIKDRVMIKDFWKLPGGAANLGEHIHDTAVREVYEETGIKTKFCSVIAFRQQHNYPTAFGRSDLYIICRLEPLNFEINKCNDEIKACEWLDLDQLCESNENNITKTMAKLIRYGRDKGFEHIDITPREMSSPFKGRFYNLYFRQIPDI